MLQRLIFFIHRNNFTDHFKLFDSKFGSDFPPLFPLFCLLIVSCFNPFLRSAVAIPAILSINSLNHSLGKRKTMWCLTEIHAWVEWASRYWGKYQELGRQGSREPRREEEMLLTWHKRDLRGDMAEIWSAGREWSEMAQQASHFLLVISLLVSTYWRRTILVSKLVFWKWESGKGINGVNVQIYLEVCMA